MKIKKFRTLFTFILFAFLGICKIAAQGSAAPSHKCGVFQKLGGIPDGYGGPIYYDRFGNAWSEDEITNLSSNVQDECDAGVFKLSFSGTYSFDKRDQVCAALSYLSGVVGGGPVGIVPLKIEFVNNVDGNGAAASSFMDLGCGLMKNFAFVNIRTGSNKLPLGFFAGLIKIDTDPDWYTGPVPSQVDWDNLVGKVDLFTAVLHEGMHILGVASTFGGVELNGGNVVQGYFTDWDRYLYDKNGSDYIKLIESANDPDCCSRHIKNPNAPNNFPGDCLVDIMFRDGTTDLAEVSYNGLNPNNAGEINNRLSHLDIFCSPNPDAPAFQYVMHPGLPPSPALYSFPRRDVPFWEQRILCNLGYNLGSCDKCAIVANDDFPPIIFLNSAPPSNPIRLNTGLGGTPSDGIPGTGSDLLANDIFPAGALMELCGNDPEITVVPIFDTETGLKIVRIDVFGTDPGDFTFCYRVRGCSSSVCDEATVHITVLENPVATFCNTDDCNLVCFGDFEGFPLTQTYYTALNLPEFYFVDLSNQMKNTPDIILQTDIVPHSKAVRWVRSTFVGQDQESLRIPLSQPIYPGCTATIHYQAAVSDLNINTSIPDNIQLEVYGLTGPPCGTIDNHPVWAGAGVPSQFCPGVTAYGMDQNADVYFDVDVSGPYDNTVDLDLADYTFNYTHPLGALPVTDLLIWGTFTPSNPPPPFGGEGVEFYMDNITVTSSCNTQIQITPHVVSQCIGGQAVIEYEVCLLGDVINIVMADMQADIPFGLTVVPGGDFDENGLTSLQLTPATECSASNTAIVTLTMDVSPNFDPLQAPIPVNIMMNLASMGLCIDPATGGGGDVTLMLQSCVPAATCHCPPNTGYELGANMDSQTDLSTSGLPLLLENTCLALSGRLYVDQNFTIKNTEIIMNRGAEIVVREKLILKLEGNQIHGCQEMWRGITVLGRLEAEGNEIKDAQWAIRSENKSTITVTDNDFKQNFTAFYAPDMPTGVNSVNTIKISGNEVTCADPLLPAYTVLGNPDHQQVPAPGERTFAAAYLNDVVKSFDFQKDNVFDGIRNGIVANNSGFSMDRCTIKNLVTYLYPQGQSPGGDFNHCLYGVRAADCPTITVANSDVSGVHRGVLALRSNITVGNNVIDADIPISPSESGSTIPTAIRADFGTNRAAIITGNTLTSCGQGIDLNQWQPASKLLVSDNDISLATCSISFNSSGIAMEFCTRGEVSDNTVKPLTPSVAKGLSLANCRDNFVNGNTFYDLFKGESGENNVNCYFLGNTAKSDITNGSPNGTAGTGFTNAFSDNPYCCNTVDGLSGNGFEFDGPSTGTSFKYSQIKDAAMGLQLTESTDISPQTHARNRWFAGNAGAFHESQDESFIDLSQFTCEPALIPPFGTAADQPGDPVDWFKAFPLPPGPIQPLCVCPYPQGPGGGDLPRVTPEGDYLAAVGGYQLGQYSDAYNWMTRQRLYERLLKAPQLADTSAYIAAFYQSAGSSAIGQFDAVKQGIRDLIGRNHYSREVIGQSIERLGVLSEELRLLRQDTAASELQQRIKAHQLQREVERYKSYLKAVEQQQDHEIGALLSANTGLSAGTVPQTNEKTLNRIVLENRLWESSSIIAAHVNLLQLVAAQCPLSGGFAVYEARGVLRALGEGQNWETENLCDPVTSERGHKKGEVKELAELYVYPNPANNIVNFEKASTEAQDTDIEIFSSLGDKLQTLRIPTDQTSVEWNTRGISNGLYWYKVKVSGRSNLSGKIVIIH